jgi:hypothetical protein
VGRRAAYRVISCGSNTNIEDWIEQRKPGLPMRIWAPGRPLARSVKPQAESSRRLPAIWKSQSVTVGPGPVALMKLNSVAARAGGTTRCCSMEVTSGES